MSDIVKTAIKEKISILENDYKRANEQIEDCEHELNCCRDILSDIEAELNELKEIYKQNYGD